MNKILIKNTSNFHYECIESVIIKHKQFFKLEGKTELFLWLHPLADSTFINYIKNKYENIKFVNKEIDFDYYINCTIYDHDFDQLSLDKNKKYIAHEISDRLKTNPNVHYLTPLAGQNFFRADYLPFCDKKEKSKPIYIIQGNLNGSGSNRRNLSLLINILEDTYEYNFTIKLVGKGVLPLELKPYKDKILLKNNLNFIDYHKEFLNVWCILPLITKESHPQYYTKKLTSTINYSTGYNIKAIIDEDLQKIYKLKNAEVFKKNIVPAFKNTLEEYYKKHIHNETYIKSNIF